MIRKIRASVCNDVMSWLSGSHTKALEEEVARLRAENRALVNSILGVAGIPPMRFGAAVKAQAGVQPSQREDASIRTEPGLLGRPKGRLYEKAWGAMSGSSAAARAEGRVRGVRRRSWQQIGRALEVEDALAARRERESDAETFPVPRNIFLRRS